MRDILLFTKNPMVYADCEQAILAGIKNVDANQKESFWSTSKVFWNLDIYNETIFENATDPDYIQELTEWANTIPIKDPYINYMGIHRSIDAKRVIKVLMTIYPELYVFKDDDATWQGTAQEYLDTEFDF